MLSRFVDSRRLNAGLLVAAGVLVPLALVLAAAAVALVALRRNLVVSFSVAIGAWAAVAGLMWVAGAGLRIEALATCLAAGVLGETLRRSNSLALALVVGLALAMMSLLIFFVLVQDPAAYWRQLVTGLIAEFVKAGADISPQATVTLLTVTGSPAWTGVYAAIGLLTCYCALFIGRSWQAALANPGGFRREFHALQLGRHLAVVSAVCFVLAGGWQNETLLNLAVLLFLLWTIQGLAVMHGMLGAIGASGAWLVPVYLLTVLGWPGLSPFVLAVPLLGLINQFYDFRKLVRKRQE